jgi:hypothetical protein
MGVGIWGELPQMSIRPSAIAPVAKERRADVARFLSEIGSNDAALNTFRMEQGKLKPLFKDFDPEKITPAGLEKVGKQLYSFGLIDNLTADLFGRAALEFDKKGNPRKPDEEINALEFFAQQVEGMKDKSYTGDKYAKMLLPDYIRAVHVMMCLQDFGSKGEGFDSIVRKKREADGEIPKQEAMKPVR